MPQPKKANARTKVFRFRLNDDEDKRFRQLAKDRGVDRADLIRETLGLEAGATAAPSQPPATTKPDPKKEPGAAGIVEVAERVQRKKGKGK